MRRYIWIGALILLLLTGLKDVAAQGNVAQWLRYDVTLTVQQNSGITVEEVHEVALVSGARTFQRVIPTDKLETIDNIQVLGLNPSGGQRAYQEADTQAEYTFQVETSEDYKTIELYFPPNNAASTKFVLRYFVVGTFRFYNEGDQLVWRPFGNVATAPIGTSTITVNLPADIGQEQLKQSSTGVGTENFIPEANKAVFRATGIDAGDNLEILLTLPHGIVQGRAPAWQRHADTTPYFFWGSIILTALLLLVGPLAAFGWWYLQLRVVPASSKKVPKYVKSPPGPLSPAVAGALLDGKTTPRHITATLLDLASKGALNVYSRSDNKDDAEGVSETVFDLYNVDQEKAVEPYEATLYGKIFGYMGARTRTLSDVRRTVYMATPELKNQIEAEIAKAGYFVEDTGMVRRQYAAFGGAGIIMAIVLALVSLVVFSSYTYLVACPCLSIIIGAAAFIAAGFAKSNRTEVGATEAVRWEAFKRYLQDLNPDRAAKDRQRFPRLLPYAVAFGLEKRVVENFAAANTATPKWWSIPEEKLPDIDHEDAHAWVSASVMSQPKAQSESKKPSTKSGIRRLGEPGKGAEPGAALKDIQPVFMTFLKAALDVFAKAPPIDTDEEVDFESLGHD